MSIRLLLQALLVFPMCPAVARSQASVPLFSYEDYPKESVARREEGVVRARLNVSAEGRVTGCFITQSATPALDAATCRILTVRARFTPELDSAGKAIASEYNTPAIRWQLRDSRNDKPAPQDVRL